MKNFPKIFCLFIGWLSFSQTCQVINTQLDNASPSLNPDGIMQVCVDETITLEGSATFADNDVGAIYTWDLGDSREIIGTNASFSYTQPGIYIVNLRVSGTNTMRCSTSTDLELVIQVADTPDFRGTVATDNILCFGESTIITGAVTPTEVAFNCTPPVGTTTALPDGVGVPYETSVFVDCYAPGSTLTDINQIISICLNIEHSFLGDLTIEIVAPDGKTVILFNGDSTLSANLGMPWAVGAVDANSTNLTPGTGSEYCFLPNTRLRTLAQGIATGGVFVDGDGPGTYLDNFVPAGDYRSQFSLDGLLGAPLNGEWKIRITDNFAFDNGNIFEWQISFDSALLPSNFTVTPAIVSEAWDTDPSITNTTGNTITVLPSSVGTNCYTFRAIDEFGCQYTEEVCIEVIRDVFIDAQPTDIYLCDSGSNGIETFDFSNNENLVRGSQPTSEVIVSFHPTENDAMNNSSVLATPYNNTLANETIWVRVADATQLCFEVASFDIQVLTNPIANAVIDYELCDDNSDGDDTNGLVAFDLSSKINEVLGTQNAADYEVKFYDSKLNADNGVVGTEISNTFSNTSNPETVYARVEHRLNSDCFAVTNFDLIVNPLPTINPVVVLEQCDDDTDGITDFNLTEANILISPNYLNETFTYYLTEVDAEGLLGNRITNEISFRYPNATSVTSVYARVETENGCHRVAQIDLVVGVSQIPPAFTTLEYFECDTKDVDNDDFNGVATFDFSDAEQTIRNLFPSPQNFSITFYESEMDALAETNAIPDISNHRNDASPVIQNIYVRIDSNDVNSCLGLGHHITLNVNPLPNNNTIAPYVLCSDSNTTTFDLTTKDAEVIGIQTRSISVSYHATENDAINNSPIPNPNTYNGADGETIFIRAFFDDNGNGIVDGNECVNTNMSFQLSTIPNPVIFNPDPIIVCSDQLNANYDLTLREDQITGGDTSIQLSYFETQTDLDNNNPIVNPSQYNNSLSTSSVFVLATGSNGCTSTVNMELNTILYENLNLFPSPLEECEIDNNGFGSFDLTRSEIEILNGLNEANFIFDYYEDRSDAENGSSSFILDPTAFENTQIRQQTLFVRVTPITNDCFQIAELPIIVNPVPEIQIAEEYVICISSDNSVIPAQGNVLIASAPIDTQLSVLDYSFEWYTGSVPDATNVIIGETDAIFFPQVAGDYTVIATDLVSGCTIPATTTVISSYPPESIAAEVTTDAFSENDIIEVSVVGNGIYEFSLDDGEWQNSPIFENVRGGEHIVSVRDIYNCNSLNSESLIVIDYPRYFTPNGDNFNEFWQIKGINNQADARIFIYNRYGKLLKQLSPFEEGWDGTYGGNVMPTDSYWFTVEFNDINKGNTRKLFRAYFALKR
ncbi:MAG: T9SS type B sorting domain-containing protein [Jejuia sp.]